MELFSLSFFLGSFFFSQNGLSEGFEIYSATNGGFSKVVLWLWKFANDFCGVAGDVWRNSRFPKTQMNPSVYMGHTERVHFCLYTSWNPKWLTHSAHTFPGQYTFTIKPRLYVSFHYPNKLNLHHMNINLWNMSDMSDFPNFVANNLLLIVDNIKAILYQNQTS